MPAENTTRPFTRLTSSPQQKDVIIGILIKDLTVDDHNTALFVGNLSICNKFNESMKKWVSCGACSELFL